MLSPCPRGILEQWIVAKPLAFLYQRGDRFIFRIMLLSSLWKAVRNFFLLFTGAHHISCADQVLRDYFYNLLSIHPNELDNFNNIPCNPRFSLGTTSFCCMQHHCFPVPWGRRSTPGNRLKLIECGMLHVNMLHLSHATQSHATCCLLLNQWNSTFDMQQCCIPHVAKMLLQWNTALTV